MILAFAFAFALAAEQDHGQFRYREWSGQCHRMGYLAGDDHEVCRFGTANDGDDRADGSFLIERTAEKLTVNVFVSGSCVESPGQAERSGQDDEEETHLPASALAGPDRVAKLKAFIHTLTAATDKICGRTHRYPKLRDRDLAKLLRITDGLRPGNFRLHDPADRAPLAAKCGREFEVEWRAGIAAHPPPASGHVQLMMYTMSKEGPDLASRRIEAAPEMMEDYFAMGMGPGGSTMQGRKSAAAWRNPPSAWFVDICDIAIESWSGFVELGLYGNDEPSSQLFTARASTGVAQMDGFAISQTRIVQ